MTRIRMWGRGLWLCQWRGLPARLEVINNFTFFFEAILIIPLGLLPRSHVQHGNQEVPRCGRVHRHKVSFSPPYHYSLYIYHYISLYITISLFNFQQTFLSLDKGETKATNVGMWKWIHWCLLRGINWEIPLFSEFKYFRPGRNKIEQCGIYTSCKNSIGKIGWYSVNELEKLNKSFPVAKFMRTFSLNYFWCFNPSPLLLFEIYWYSSRLVLLPLWYRLPQFREHDRLFGYQWVNLLQTILKENFTFLKP